MADFLAPVTYTAFKSPVPAIDVGVWANIAEMGFKQNMLMQDMLDKSYQSVAAVNPTLNQDKDYVNKKKEELDKKLEAFTNKGPFISPKNMGAIRQLSREYAFDKEFQAINNRTAKIAETNKRINDEKLPMFNYLDFNDSIEKANADYEANKTYNPDVKLNFNITPYSNVMEKMMKVVDNIPEISEAKLDTDETGNYMYVRTVSGRSFEHTKAALMASLDTKDYAQLQAEYNGLLRTSPESLIPEKDVLDGNGQVMYKQGEMLTFEQFATNEVLKITAAVTGQSVDIDNLQKSMSAEEYLLRAAEDAKNNGKSTESHLIGESIYTTPTSAIGQTKGQALNATINEVEALQQQVSTLETQIQNSAGVDMTNAQALLATTKAQLVNKKAALASATSLATQVIPKDDRMNIYSKQGSYRLNRFGAKSFLVAPGMSQDSYATRYGKLKESLAAEVASSKMSDTTAKAILASLPYTPDDSLSAEEQANMYVSKILSTDLEKEKQAFRNSDAFKEWDASSWTRGSIAGALGYDATALIFQTAAEDKEYINYQYKAAQQNLNAKQNEVGTLNTISSSATYISENGTNKPHPIAVMNNEVTNNVQTFPNSYIDIYTGEPLDKILIDADKVDIKNVTAQVTDGFVGGHHVIAVSTNATKSGTGGRDYPDEVYYVYNTQDTYAKRTEQLLMEGGMPFANQFRYERQYLTALQVDEPLLNGMQSMSASDAIAKDNALGVPMGTTDGQTTMLKVYKVADGTYLVGTQVGDGPPDIEKAPNGEYLPFNNLRHAVQYIGRQTDFAANKQFAKGENQKATMSAVNKAFYDTTPEVRQNLMSVIGFETAHEYSPATVNKLNQKAVGLIQFYTDDKGFFKLQTTAADGTKVLKKWSKEQLKAMTHEEQALLIREYFKANNVDINTLNSPVEVWLPIFMPALHHAYKAGSNRSKTVKEIIETQTQLKWSEVKGDNKSTGLTDTITLQQFVDKMAQKFK